MSDISFALEAKSNQLNAVDLGGEMVITIRDVKVQKTDQPVWIYFHGDNNRPWKPSKGILRILATGWGKDSSQWIGKSAKIFCNPSVTWAGKEVGGIQVSAMSDIPSHGIKTILRSARTKTEPYKVDYLDMRRPVYPAEQFEQAFGAMVAAMESGKMTLQQVIAHCQKTGDLTPEQLKRLEEKEPKEEEKAP